LRPIKLEQGRERGDVANSQMNAFFLVIEQNWRRRTFFVDQGFLKAAKGKGKAAY
jgi:hypothetical protein